MEEHNIFQDLPMSKLVCKMAVPIIITMIIQALYNVVDSLFVAQLGIKPLSALGIAYPIQMIMIAVSNGIGVGMNSVVSRRMGNGDIQEAGRATGNAITLALIATATMALFGFLGTNTFFQISTNDTEIIAYGTTYLSICCIFSFGLFLSIIGQRMLQVAGQPTWSMVVQMSGCAFNIIFDPIMIFGLLGFPALGVTGAAIATVGGQMISPMPPIITGGALIIPRGLIHKLMTPTAPGLFGHGDRQAIEYAAMNAVIQIEVANGFRPKDVSAAKCGYDVESFVPESMRNRLQAHALRMIEVKGRAKGATTVTVSKNEILTALNKPEEFILAIVEVDGATTKTVYLKHPFKNAPDFTATSVNFDIQDLIAESEILYQK